MKKKHFIIGLIIIIVISLIVSLQIQVKEGNKGKGPAPAPPKGPAPAAPAPAPAAPAPAAPKVSPPKVSPSVTPITIAQNLKNVESILNGQLTIDPKTDTDYLDALKTHKCNLILAGKPLLNTDYIPLSGINPKNTYTFSDCTVANDVANGKIGLIPLTYSLLDMHSGEKNYPIDNLTIPLVFYAAYLVKLQKNISPIAKASDQEKNSLVEKLNNINFVNSNDGKKDSTVSLDEVISEVHEVLSKAFNTGKINTADQANFLCNFATINTTNTGIIQKITPLLVCDFKKIGYSRKSVYRRIQANTMPLNGTRLICK